MRTVKIMQDYSEILERYLIPAEEGFLFTDIREDNITKLGEKRTLLVFTTDDTIDYGGINYKKYLTKYNFSKVVSFPLDRYILYRIKADTQCPKMDVSLRSLLEDKDKITFNDNNTIGELTKMILSICDEYSKNTNTMVIAYLSDTNRFSYTFMREYPIVITHASIVKSVLHGITSSNSLSVKQLVKHYESFKRLDNIIPKSLFVKDMKFDLFHISPNGEIKELTPRITSKPLKSENIGIYRISAAPSIDACFRAIGIGAVEREKDKRKKYYVYKLRISKDTRIVKPTKELVPDQEYTNEYWILDPVPVDLLGTITVSVDEKQDKLLFDTTDMPEDPMITTKWKHVKP